MTIKFDVLGFTIASVSVDLSSLIGDDEATQVKPIDRLVKRTTVGWFRRMMAS
jgi:hypothetical protein